MGTGKTRNLRKAPHIRLGRVEFSTHKINAAYLKSKGTLSGKVVKAGKTLRVGGKTHIYGALYLRGKGHPIKSKVTKKTLHATVFVNKKNRKGCGIAVSNRGGFFDHNDGFVTYEPLAGKKGFKVNAPMLTSGALFADGTLHLGGNGKAGKKVSKVTGRTVYTMLHTNRHMALGGGFAVSKSGGFFDFKDNYITFEPIEGHKGLNINSKFDVQKTASFKTDVSVKGTLSVDGDINVGGVRMGMFGKAFSGYKKKHDNLEDRVKELESTNTALTERLQRMEMMMQELMSKK